MSKQRNEEIIIHLILQVAKDDERIRAVLMNGSRASPTTKKDIFQDYDIVYLVAGVESFVNDGEWINQFGEILIMQMPDAMDGVWPNSKDKYTYLMQFTDWNRIDLTLLTLSKWLTLPKDSQSILLLDKDDIVKKWDAPSDEDYFPTPPTETEFHNCCNEFLWVATYVAKGIWRKELTYAKHVSEQIVKEELIKLLTWHAGLLTGYQKNIGKFGRHLQQYIEPERWNKLAETYVDANYMNMWKSLFLMCEIFNDVAIQIANHFGYRYNPKKHAEVIKYLTDVKNF